jgi:hypothetical protein
VSTVKATPFKSARCFITLCSLTICTGYLAHAAPAVHQSTTTDGSLAGNWDSFHVGSMLGCARVSLFLTRWRAHAAQASMAMCAAFSIQLECLPALCLDPSSSKKLPWPGYKRSWKALHKCLYCKQQYSILSKILHVFTICCIHRTSIDTPASLCT